MMISNNKTISMTEAGQNVSTVRCVPQEDSHQTRPLQMKKSLQLLQNSWNGTNMSTRSSPGEQESTARVP